MAPIPTPRRRRSEDPAPPAHRIARPFRWLVELFGLLTGELDFTIAFFFCLALVPAGLCVAALFMSIFHIIVAIITCIAVIRHCALTQAPPPIEQRHVFKQQPDAPAPDTSSLPAVYFLYVLGSGGHSAELIEAIKNSFSGGINYSNHHRRYIVTSGDNSSTGMIYDLSCKIKNAFPEQRGGTMDVVRIRRARAVHQSSLTAPFTCLVSAVEAIHAMTSEPDLRPAEIFNDLFKYPHWIVTNGPATAFIVAMVAHMLKMLCLVPPECLNILYIESFARTQALSLTGKLFYWTGIAQTFMVQHESLQKNLPGSVLFPQRHGLGG